MINFFSKIRNKFRKILIWLSPIYRMEPDRIRGFKGFFVFLWGVVLNFADRAIRASANLFFHRNEVKKISDVDLYKIDLSLILPNSVIYSFGVGNNINFDRKLSYISGATVHLFDPTPLAVDFMSKQAKNEKLVFEPMGVWTQDGLIKFYNDRNKTHRNLSVTNYFKSSGYIEAQCKTIKTIMNDSKHSYLDVLKLDIEGAGLIVLDDLLNKTDIRPRQIIGELEMPQMIYGASIKEITDFFRRKIKLFADLNKNNYRITTYGKAEFLAVLDSKYKVRKNIFKRILSKINKLSQKIISKYYKYVVVKNMKFEFKPCIICGNNEKFALISKKDRYKLPVKVQKCIGCGFVMSRPSLTKKSMDLLYSSRMYRGLYLGILSADKNNNDNADQKAKTHNDFIDSLGYDISGNVLDIGSAFGAFLLEYKKRHSSVNIYGVEPGANFKYFNAEKFSKIFDNLEEIPVDMKFSLVTMWHVLEHVYDAKDFLFKISKILAPDGRLIIEVPDYDKYNGNIKFLHIAHNYHFNRDSLMSIAKLAGLKVEKFSDEYCIPNSAGIKVVYRKA